jgi:hypothetical protein
MNLEIYSKPSIIVSLYTFLDFSRCTWYISLSILWDISLIKFIFQVIMIRTYTISNPNEATNHRTLTCFYNLIFFYSIIWWNQRVYDSNIWKFLPLARLKLAALNRSANSLFWFFSDSNTEHILIKNTLYLLS